jgi:hypothetical protein
MRNMTAAQLIEALEGVDPDTEVRLMTQQNYPFENALICTWAPDEDGDDVDEDERAGGFTPADGREFGHRPEGPAPKVLYLVEGRQLGYGTKDAWNS